MRKRIPIPSLVRHENDYFYIHWTIPGPKGQRGRSRCKTTREKDADRATIVFAKWLLARAEGAPQVPTVASLWEAYFEGHVSVKAAAVDRIERCWANLKPHFGRLFLEEVSYKKVRQYLKKRRRGVIGKPSQPQTVRRELGALIAALNWCAHPARKIISKDSVPYIELPEHGAPRDRWLTTDEINRLFAAAANNRRGNTKRLSRCERFLWLALETAARKMAICQLTWNRVDFETNVIHYDVPGQRQTKKGRASVPISSALRPVLERMKAESPRNSPLVMLTPTDPLGLLKRVADHAGLDDVSPHVLRHTAATHMARRGISLWKIAKILGNSLAMVERVYAKHAPDDLREAVDTITGDAVEKRQ